MGDPKKRRKKYSTPTHPWQEERIAEEKLLLEEYGLKNKKDIWRSNSLLRNFKRQAKRLITLSTKQAEVEKEQLLKKMASLGLLEKNAKLEAVLSVNLKDILERRLQTVVYRKKLSKSIGQARQFITHRHVDVAGAVIDVPSYLVSTEEEPKVGFRARSSLFNESHPERAIGEQKPVKKEKSKELPRKRKSGKREKPKAEEKKKGGKKKE